MVATAGGHCGRRQLQGFWKTESDGMTC